VCVCVGGVFLGLILSIAKEEKALF
jgi:hypothetical protein